jgi:Tol biopolymer transport system component
MRIITVFFSVFPRAPRIPRPDREEGMAKLSPWVAPCLLILMIACSPAQRTTGNYKIALVPSRAGQNGIFVINSDTTGGKLLMPDPTAQLTPFSWSPDGKEFVFFAAQRDDARLITKYPMPYHFPLYLMDSGGFNRKRLLDYTVSSFKWSPDSRQLLYTSAYEDPERSDNAVKQGKKTPMSAIYILNLETGEQQRLSELGKHCSGDWSPDGARLALSFGTDQSSDIYVVSLDGKHKRCLTDSKSINTKPVWSPDSKSIAYISADSPGSKDSFAGIYVINADGSGKKRVSEIGGYEVAWSPDGNSLLIQSAAELVLASADGSQSSNLTPVIGRPLDAVFTPDGKDVMFRLNYEGTWHLFAIKLETKKLRQITGNLSASTFCLSPLR